MNDEEIKKALECCRRDDYDYCKVCPYLNKNKPCQESLIRDCFGFINRQQAEIERLQSLCTAKDVIIKEQEAEIERLQNTIDDVLDRQPLLVERAEKYAIKEFAERLESKYTKVVSCNAGYVYRTIKEVEKEMVGGENA